MTVAKNGSRVVFELVILNPCGESEQFEDLLAEHELSIVPIDPLCWLSQPQSEVSQ